MPPLPEVALPAFFALALPSLSEESREGRVAAWRAKLAAGERSLDDIRALHGADGLRAAVSLDHLWDASWGLSPLLSAAPLPTDPDDEVFGLLAEAVARAQARGVERLHLRLPEPVEPAAYAEALRRAGLSRVDLRVEFRGPVSALPDDSGSPLRWQTMDEVGEARAAELFGEVGVGAPDWDPADDPAALIRDYLADPALNGEPSCVQVGFEGDAPVAVCIAQVDPSRGWSRITYMGLLPEARGRGLGAWVHRRGFTMMKAQGGETYHGGTSTRNAAMLRLFERHGVPELRRLAEWSWPPR